jgi:hypothetical protein
MKPKRNPETEKIHKRKKNSLSTVKVRLEQEEK